MLRLKLEPRQRATRAWKVGPGHRGERECDARSSTDVCVASGRSERPFLRWASAGFHALALCVVNLAASAFLAFCTAAFVLDQAARAEALSDADDKASYADALAYCRWNVPKPMALRDDKRVACFDGEIKAELDLSLVEGLGAGGLFVVRSSNAEIAAAIRLADLLLSKQAVVIINDYCLANCANYIFVASLRTFVPKDALVAWRFVSEPRVCIDLSGEHHYEAPGVSPCNGSFRGGRRNGEIDQLKRKFSEGRARSSALSRAGFLSDRPRHDLDQLGPLFELPPQSAAVGRTLKEMADARGGLPGVYWTWNPRFYPSVLTTKVFYEAYPQSQDEVDAIAKRTGLGVRVIYDP
jgi:hypothetical protein